MTIILAADSDWAIGRDGGLLAHIPEDMKFFRETTANSTVVMGRKTWESIGAKPLPGRVNCVISRSVKQLDGAQVFGSVEEFLGFAEKAEGKVFFTDLEHDRDWEIVETSPVMSSECRNIRFFHYIRKK